MLATVRARSSPFAQTPYLQRLRVGRANASEPERTPSAAIAAIVIVDTFNSRGPAARPALATADDFPPRSGPVFRRPGFPSNSARPNLRTLRVEREHQPSPDCSRNGFVRASGLELPYELSVGRLRARSASIRSSRAASRSSASRAISTALSLCPSPSRFRPVRSSISPWHPVSFVTCLPLLTTARDPTERAAGSAAAG